MAEKSAHLTGTTYIKPTIFEIVAQESLTSTLEPAFKKILSFCISCNPERYKWFEQWSNEAYAVFHGFLQNFYLNNYTASFSETFYGLKRINPSNSTINCKLSEKQRKLSLILLVLYPYIQSKVQQYKLDEVDGKLPRNEWQRFLRRHFIKAHQIFLFIYEILGIYYYLAYISNHSSYPSPIFNLLSLTLTYSQPTEVISISEIFDKWKNGNFYANDGIHLIQRGCMKTLEFSAFLLQFINWWNQENYHTNLLSLPLPPSPTISVIANQYAKICPVCLKIPNIPTALTVSGYVFCYTCITEKLHIEGKCPVTGYPAKEDNLIRIYVNY
ncbi:hypothetical protein PV327_001176 [Microctonus hyperodae]|uniref:Peroxisome assembly protein 12 n=1 Tax=Microctonus hyperodae TaxID=165561 RepID=A0AA39G8V6_MICHY|nr:hypothetical protein PV327_001176 [Microctonus hyperodae]